MDNHLGKGKLSKILDGTYAELVENSKVLFKLGLIDKVYGDDDTISDWFECCEKVDEAYRRVGVTFVSKFAKWNKYFYKGREITRKEAQRVARDYARSLAQTPIGA